MNEKIKTIAHRLNLLFDEAVVFLVGSYVERFRNPDVVLEKEPRDIDLLVVLDVHLLDAIDPCIKLSRVNGFDIVMTLDNWHVDIHIMEKRLALRRGFFSGEMVQLA